MIKMFSSVLYQRQDKAKTFDPSVYSDLPKYGRLMVNG